jgi:hypothetical protein
MFIKAKFVSIFYQFSKNSLTCLGKSSSGKMGSPLVTKEARVVKGPKPSNLVMVCMVAILTKQQYK